MNPSYDNLMSRLQAIQKASPFVRIEPLGAFNVDAHEYEIYRIVLTNDPPAPVSICISAGIHGDEPASVEAMARFLEQNAHNTQLLIKFSFTIFPCDNPSGYELGIRENAAGVDLNREFHTKHPATEAVILTKALEESRFDHVYELHEDVDSYGFYLYELAVDRHLRVGSQVIQEISAAGYPVNLQDCIEGREAHCGVISPAISRMRRGKLPKAVYAYRLGNPHVMTFETPGMARPFEERVKMQLMALKVAIGRSAEMH